MCRILFNVSPNKSKNGEKDNHSMLPIWQQINGSALSKTMQFTKTVSLLMLFLYILHYIIRIVVQQNLSPNQLPNILEIQFLLIIRTQFYAFYANIDLRKITFIFYKILQYRISISKEEHISNEKINVKYS